MFLCVHVPDCVYVCSCWVFFLCVCVCVCSDQCDFRIKLRVKLRMRMQHTWALDVLRFGFGERVVAF